MGVMTYFKTEGETVSQEPKATLAMVRELDLPTAQIIYPPQLDSEVGRAQICEACAALDVEITTVFCSFTGELYGDIPTVRATVGLVPEATRAQRMAVIETISTFAQALGVARVAAHIGFIPEDPHEAHYVPLVQTLQRVCDRVTARDQVFALETGQETGRTLHRFIGDVDRANLRVNFDPANMILYGNDDPVRATTLLSPWIDGVHCKDGRWPVTQGILGRETPFGEGDVNVSLWLKTLLATGYRGPLTIEREIHGEEQHQDIWRARRLLEGLLQNEPSRAST